jgi:3,4-dihydroxy-2-butanone 4-phosphate synthase
VIVVDNARTNHAEAVMREAQGLGVKALAVIADMAKTDKVEMLATRALSEFGRHRRQRSLDV